MILIDKTVHAHHVISTYSKNSEEFKGKTEVFVTVGLEGILSRREQ
jgi:hypothetical protein